MQAARGIMGEMKDWMLDNAELAELVGDPMYTDEDRYSFPYGFGRELVAQIPKPAKNNIRHWGRKKVRSNVKDE
jgi:hypothetical protein